MDKIKGGFVLQPRKVIESDIWRKPPLYYKVWSWLIIKAQHSNFKELKRGELWTSIPEIQEAMSYNVGYRKEMPTYKEIRDIIDYLRKNVEGHNEGITKGNMIGTTKGTHGVVIQIRNYDLYQDIKNYEGQDERQDERSTKGNARAKYKQECNKNEQYILYIPLAQKLKDLILKNNPTAKVPDNLNKWAEEVEKMERIDKRTKEDIEKVIEYSQTNTFWIPHILSMDKLRKKFDTLYMQIKNPKPTQQQQPNKNKFINFKQSDYDFKELEKIMEQKKLGVKGA